MEEGFKQDYNGSHQYDSFKVLFFVFVAHHTSSVVEQPCKEPLYFPSAVVSSELSSILRLFLLARAGRLD